MKIEKIIALHNAGMDVSEYTDEIIDAYHNQLDKTEATQCELADSYYSLSAALKELDTVKSYLIVNKVHTEALNNERMEAVKSLLRAFEVFAELLEDK